MASEAVVIGLLEDDRDQADLYRVWLEQAGFLVRVYNEVKDFRRRLGAESIDLLLLDWNLGEGSGLDLLEWMRQSAHARLPVIFLTARTAEEDIVSGLKAGADDYVVKPAKQTELIARIQTVLRRSGVANTATSSAGNWVDEVLPYKFDVDKRSVTLNGDLIDLTDREFDLASYLFRRHGRIVSRDRRAATPDRTPCGPARERMESRW